VNREKKVKVYFHNRHSQQMGFSLTTPLLRKKCLWPNSAVQDEAAVAGGAGRGQLKSDDKRINSAAMGTNNGFSSRRGSSGNGGPVRPASIYRPTVVNRAGGPCAG
jgi:hypothetical protein